MWPLPLPTAAEMQAYDCQTIGGGVSSVELMERAGEALYRRITAHYNPHRAVILAGPGNNGGDGVVLARHLLENSRQVIVIIPASRRYSEELAIVCHRLFEKGGAVHIIPDVDYVPPPFDYAVLNADQARQHVSNADLLVDALLGTGQKAAPHGGIGKLVDLTIPALKGETCVFSVDVPTGVNCDTGEVYSPHIRADRTIAIEFVKRGLLQWPARDVTGEIETISIGIAGKEDPQYTILDDRSRRMLRPRHRVSHKGDFGHVLVVGGSTEMPGAPVLAAIGALRTGAGLVSMVYNPERPACLTPPEIMLRPISFPNLCLATLSEVERSLSKCTSLIIGPGVGLRSDTEIFINKIIERLVELKIPYVLDADALTILSRASGKIELGNCVITPHPGEASRLLGVDATEIQRDRYTAAQELGRIYQCCVVLKGAGSIIWSGHRGTVNLSGTPYMASGGVGDVLAGIVGAFLAQGYSAYDAASMGVFFHGRAGQLAVDADLGPITASRLCDFIPAAIGVSVE